MNTASAIRNARTFLAREGKGADHESDDLLDLARAVVRDLLGCDEHAWTPRDDQPMPDETQFECTGCGAFGRRRHHLLVVEQVERLDDAKSLMVCAHCGSRNVQWLDWVRDNGATPCGDYGGSESYCETCQANDLDVISMQEFISGHGYVPNHDCDDPACRGWCHMDDSHGRGPGIERCDTCKRYPDDAAAIRAHDHECKAGAACAFRAKPARRRKPRKEARS